MRRMSPNAYESYEVKVPLATHWRRATCAEIDCPDYLSGWQVRVEHVPPALLHMARTSGRKFVPLHVRDGETYLVFEAGQPCFQVSTHRKRLERGEIFVVRRGDGRGNPTGDRTVMSGPTPWVDRFGENQEKLAARIQRG